MNEIWQDPQELLGTKLRPVTEASMRCVDDAQHGDDGEKNIQRIMRCLRSRIQSACISRRQDAPELRAPGDPRQKDEACDESENHMDRL